MSFELYNEEANCIGADPDAFFIRLTPRTSKQDRIRHDTAMSLCETCPIKGMCRDFAVKNSLQGIFGGVYVPPKM